MITASISYIITKNTVDYTIYTRELAESGDLLTHNKDQAVLTLMDLDTVIETNFKTVHPDMTLGEMLHDSVAKSARNIFPVVDTNQKFLGIILLDDIREFMFDTKLYNTTKVETFTHKAPDHIYYGLDSMQIVMQKFQDSGAWNLPVIKNGKYMGFVSKSKLLTAYRRELIRFTK
jgi:CIC family chloride channel protein